MAKPDTILGWYRRLVAAKFDGSKCRSYPGRPRITRETEELIVRFARENPTWGYDRIAGAAAPHVFTLHTIDDAERMRSFLRERRPATAAVIGAGYIGIEAADALRRNGLAVTVFEGAPHALSSGRGLVRFVIRYLERSYRASYDHVNRQRVDQRPIHRPLRLLILTVSQQ